jgi:hypothetical protein
MGSGIGPLEGAVEGGSFFFSFTCFQFSFSSSFVSTLATEFTLVPPPATSQPQTMNQSHQINHISSMATFQFAVGSIAIGPGVGWRTPIDAR